MDEVLERAKAYLRGKEVLQNLESKRRYPLKNHHSSGSKPKFQSFVEWRSNRHHDSRRTDDRYRPPYRKNTPEKEKYVSFTALTKTPEEIMATEEARIEEEVKSGELAHLVKDIKRKNDPKGKGKEMNMIHLTRSETQKRPRRESWDKKCICFPLIEEAELIFTPIIVEAEIEGTLVNKIYMDCRAASEIMYKRCFLQLRDEVKARLEKADTPLIGFSGEKVLPLGQIELTVRLEDGPLSRTERLTFLVVQAPSRYNIIIGRPGISTFGVVVSTTHGLMKFPTDRGIATIKPKKEALLIAAAEEDEEQKQERILELSINPSYPDQNVKIRGNLSPIMVNKLKDILEESKDVFSWCPVDMVGVPRDIVEYSLNISPNIKHVVQNKRSLAPDRSQVACKEVDKLVKAGILREVQYQSWVANLVLIHMKKEDEEKTAFHTAKGIFCYKKMPFGLKNAGATYQRVIDKIFTYQIGRNREAYVDDLVIKSQGEEEMIDDIRETFDNLRSIGMKLNPGKCSFGFEEGKFLGHIVGSKV
ncbi:hypothetical protein L1987_23920 [Smallanthus sonchifolius]|uniref:Uncharacterized protein n=1 Tax=Smallanthus sonchifolius TaxID=185202 RepID=A0ACB9IKQ9_9ASTR|nr:hypothetical protein L1987_23920 [Smallanthus sonchifolius]